MARAFSEMVGVFAMPLAAACSLAYVVMASQQWRGVVRLASVSHTKTIHSCYAPLDTWLYHFSHRKDMAAQTAWRVFLTSALSVGVGTAVATYVPVESLYVRIADANESVLSEASRSFALRTRPNSEAVFANAVMRACSAAQLALVQAPTLDKREQDMAMARFAALSIVRTTQAHPFAPLERDVWIVKSDAYAELTRQKYSDAERIALLGRAVEC